MSSFYYPGVISESSPAAIYHAALTKEQRAWWQATRKTADWFWRLAVCGVGIHDFLSDAEVTVLRHAVDQLHLAGRADEALSAVREALFVRATTKELRQKIDDVLARV